MAVKPPTCIAVPEAPESLASPPPRKPVLGDHVAVKRKLIPPFLHKASGRVFQYSWTRQLAPEAIWIVLVIDRYGFEPGRKLCLAVARAAAAAIQDENPRSFLKLSAFTALTTAQKTTVIDHLGSANLAAVRLALTPLASVVAEHPLAFLGTAEAPEPSSEARFPNVLSDCYDRNSRLAVLAMAVAESLEIELGRMHVAEHLVDDLIARFEVIGDYPHTEASRSAAGGFRAGAPTLFMTHNLDGKSFETDNAWVRVFWEGVAGFGTCVIEDTFEDEAADDDDPQAAFVFAVRNAVRFDLQARLERWPLDLNEAEAYEVVAALLSRQASLVIEMAAAPAIWTPSSAPLFLRAVADVFISLAWILQAPGPRARMFVKDGLGAIKLQIAHHEQSLEVNQDPRERAQLRQMIAMWRSWLASQRIDQFVEVNLGSWSNLNTRKMAEEAGFIDFYNHVYQPFSGVAHSNWAHVSLFNLVICENPAHRNHRAPAIVQVGPDLEWLRLATKYLSKTLDHFDQVQEFTGLPHAAYELVASASYEGPDEAEAGVE